MRQVLQHLDSGLTEVAEVPAPGCGEGSPLIRTHSAGGGRILGEACHFVDLLRFLVGARINRVQGRRLEVPGASGREDSATMTLGFEEGSVGTVHYFANGSKAYPKETLEVFAGGRILVLSNFRSLVGYGWPSFRSMRSLRQDKGHAACVAAFLKAVEAGGSAPIPPEEIFEVSSAMFDLVDSMAPA